MPEKKLAPFMRFVVAVVDYSARRPWVVLASTILILGLSWRFASRLDVRTELRELLPRDSPGYLAYERQSARITGDATIIVLAKSDKRENNEQYIEALAQRLNAAASAAEADGCKPSQVTTKESRCVAALIRYLEYNTREVTAFYERNRYQYAPLSTLQEVDESLELEVAKRSGLVQDLESDDESDSPKNKASEAKDAAADKNAAQGSADKNLEELLTRLERKPPNPWGFTGTYFVSPDGGMAGLRIMTRAGALGDRKGQLLAAYVDAEAKAVQEKLALPGLVYGLAGDIPSAMAEQKSLVSEALMVTVVATLLILFGVVSYFRSLWSLVVIGLPAIFGVGMGYAFAELVYGYVNTVGAFLGAIIVGNGINYPIVLLARYRDFRIGGQSPVEARRNAVMNAFRAELVGATVAAIAYGSLMVTDFRGFAQFGVIGFVGMFSVWVAIVPLVPALVVLGERLQARVSKRWSVALGFNFNTTTRRGLVESSFQRGISWLSGHGRVPILLVATALTAFALLHIPKWLKDPWEYNFARLGSTHNQREGAGAWSRRANEVFGGKMNVAQAMMLANRPDQTAEIKRQILARDAADPQGKLIADVATIADLLPGSDAEQREKLEVLSQIRKRLSPALMERLPESLAKRVQALRPPEDLTVLVPQDLPIMLKRRFQENDGTLGAVFYVRYKNTVSLSDGRNLLRMARTTEGVRLADGTTVTTASRSSIFAELIRSIRRDGPIAAMVSLALVVCVMFVATGNLISQGVIVASLLMGVIWVIGGMALLDVRVNFLNFIALPITFGIACEYPFNLFDRIRLRGGRIAEAVRLSSGPVALCSYTTVLGYGSLVFADNKALQSFGKVAAIGEISCLVSALVVLPAMVSLLLDRKKLRDKIIGSRTQETAPLSSNAAVGDAV